MQQINKKPGHRSRRTGSSAAFHCSVAGGSAILFAGKPKAEYFHTRYERLKAEGKCPCCLRPRDSSRVVCSACAEGNRRARQKRSVARMKRGQCIICGTARSDGGRQTCASCYARKKAKEKANVFRTQWRRWSSRVRLRSRVMLMYGDQCALCGEKDFDILSLDHIEGNGAEHRASDASARNIWRWLLNHDFPPGFRVLCRNCNWSEFVRMVRSNLSSLPVNVAMRKYRQRLRVDVLEAYGGLRCSWCKQTDIDVLSLDHIKGRTRKRDVSGFVFYQRLRRTGFPAGFQVLCRNCNWKKRIVKGLSAFSVMDYGGRQ